MKKYQQALLGLTGTLIIFSVILTTFFTTGNFIQLLEGKSGQTDLQAAHAAAACQSPTKPLNPATVTAQQLTMYGLPPRPTGGNLTLWNTMISSALHRHCPTSASMKKVGKRTNLGTLASKRVTGKTTGSSKAAELQTLNYSGYTTGLGYVNSVQATFQIPCRNGYTPPTTGFQHMDAMVFISGNEGEVGIGATIDPDQYMNQWVPAYDFGGQKYVVSDFDVQCGVDIQAVVNIFLTSISGGVTKHGGDIAMQQGSAYVQFPINGIDVHSDFTGSWYDLALQSQPIPVAYNFGSIPWSQCQFSVYSPSTGQGQPLQTMGSGSPTGQYIGQPAPSFAPITQVATQDAMSFTDTYVGP